MQDIWKMEYQLVLPKLHHRNAFECSICTLKTYLSSILAGIAADFLTNLWDLLILQTEMMLNILR